MKTRMVAAVLGLLAVAGTMASAEAGEVRPTVLAPNPFAMTPPPAPLVPRPAAPIPSRPPVTPPVTVSPCCAAGYWAYQWVPTTSTTYVWVPGYVAEDGTVVAGGYAPQVVTGGYYQPVWISY